MRAPPPIPVRPTVNPTITDAKAMDQSMSTGAQDIHATRPDDSATVRLSCCGRGTRDARSPLQA
jgi:hypothetical protein